MATEEQVAACKAYMRIDGDEDDKLIGQLCDAAAAYLAAAGATRGMEDGSQRAAQYDLALWALTPGTSSAQAAAPILYTIAARIAAIIIFLIISTTLIFLGSAYY